MNQLDLCGAWKLRFSDGQRGRLAYAERDQIDDTRYIDATVPGEVHLEAMKQGWIGDVCLGLEALRARWVEQCIWSYRREFAAPPEALKQRAWLVFEQLDLVADIVLNGKKIACHRNVFYPCRVEVTGLLRPGANVLTVHVESGLFDTAGRNCAGMGVNLDSQLTKRPWMRKPQSQHGWDWSTRLLNVGISGAVRLEWTEQPARLEAVVPLITLSDDLERADLCVRCWTEGLRPQPVEAQLRIELEELSIDQVFPVTIKPTVDKVEATVQINHPQLWWPVGQGEAKLYDLRITLTVDGTTVESVARRIGFRKAEMRTTPHPDGGRYCILLVNNRPIFIKGGNWVPPDMITARADRPRYELLIDRALEANFNMLRIWGGGQYETSDFYDLCDEKGILVWQEFIFACAKYPAFDEAFLADVTHEARYNVRRLAQHPSLVVWCGNNEMEWGAWDWNYDHGVAHTDYALFHLVLPRLLTQEDPTRYYQPSSPWSLDGKNPNADNTGDQHPWTVGMANIDWRDYRKMACRFPNEGGILGPNALPTVMACLPAGQQFINSFAWQQHDNSVDSWNEPSDPNRMLEFWLGKNIHEMDVAQYVYWAGLLQGEGLREYIDNFRRRMFDSASAIFWMYNDCWPTVRSWTIVDYYLRHTPAFHPVRRAMNPVHLVLTRDGGQLLVWGINDTPQAVQATLRCGVMNLAGGFPVDQTLTVTLAANSSHVLHRFSADTHNDSRHFVPFAMLEKDGTLLARNRLFDLTFKEMTWPQAQVHVEVKQGQASFTCEQFAWGVCLDLDGEMPLADNFFDVWPHIPYRIPWPNPRPPAILRIGNLSAS